MAARDLLSQTRARLAGWFEWLTRDRARAFVVALAAVLTVSSTIWFFTGEDARGKTSRLAADAPYYQVYLPSLLLDRDLDFSNEYRITRNWYRFGRTKEGKPANVFGIGNAVFELPWFVVGHGIAHVAGSKANGFSTPEVKATLLASLFFSLGALFFAGRLLRRRFGGRYLHAVVPVLVACGGPVVYYAIRQPGYAHPFATFWVAWLVDAWDASFDRQEPRSMRTWLGLGALLGAAALARPQLALWAIIFVFAVHDDIRLGLRTGEGARLVARASMPRWAAGAAVSVACLVPQLLAWKAIYGSFYLVPQGEGFMRWDSPAWSETLFSSRNGLFPWAPLYALGAIGLFVGLRRAPRLFAALIIAVLLQAITNGAAWDWWAGGSFGGRRFDSCFIAFVAGLGALVIWPDVSFRAVTQNAKWRHWARLGAVGATVVLAAILALGNVIFASRMSGPTVRIYGGAPAAPILEKNLPSPIRQVVGVSSSAANFPARLLFAWRHDTGLDVYDRVVGVHQLGELYPGLNSFRGRTHHRIAVVDPKSPWMSGLARPSAGPGLLVAEGKARFFVGLNRFGPVMFSIRASAPEGTAAAEMIVRFNGRELARGEVGRPPTLVTGSAEHVKRGVNELEVFAPAGTRLHWVDVRAPQDPRRK